MPVQVPVPGAPNQFPGTSVPVPGAGASSLNPAAAAALQTVAGASGGPVPSTTHTQVSSATDPLLAKDLGYADKRYSGDMGAGREIDLAGEKIREAGIGTGRELTADMARRGISGTGVEGLLRARNEAGVLSGIGKAAGDITTDAEHRRDALLGTMISGAGTASADRRAQESLQLQAAEIDAQNQRAAEAAQSAKTMALLNILTGLA